MELLLKEQVKQDKMLSILMAPKLTEAVCLSGSRLLNRSSGIKMAPYLSSNPSLRQALAEGLSALSTEETPEVVAAALDSAYMRQNHSMIPLACMSNSELEQFFEELRESGALDLVLLRSKYPVECMIVQNYEVFLRLRFVINDTNSSHPKN